jgi:uncharacterized protein
MNSRVIGYDLARAYAILGMYMVNFNFCFGNLFDQSIVGRFLALFTGNSTSIFIICAGIGVTLMSHRKDKQDHSEMKKAKKVLMKRSWFLFFLGLSLYNWWPGDILHFYGGYMHIAAFILFVSKRFYIAAIIAILIIYHLLLFIIPVESSWDMSTFRYNDFWTPIGFIRNTLYNGWNSILPWMSYFLLGMWMGRMNWSDAKVRNIGLVVAFIVLVVFKLLRIYTLTQGIEGEAAYYIMSDYFPPFLPFLLITASYGFLIIQLCLWLGKCYEESLLAIWLANTGRMTLTHYVCHITFGLLLLQSISGVKYTGYLIESPLTPSFIVMFSTLYFLLSIVFSNIWLKYFNQGPIELLFRKISN